MQQTAPECTPNAVLWQLLTGWRQLHNLTRRCYATCPTIDTNPLPMPPPRGDCVGPPDWLNWLTKLTFIKITNLCQVTLKPTVSQPDSLGVKPFPEPRNGKTDSSQRDTEAKSKLSYYRRSVEQSVLRSAPIWSSRQYFYYSQRVAGLLMGWALSDERTDLRSGTRATSDYILLPKIWYALNFEGQVRVSSPPPKELGSQVGFSRYFLSSWSWS
jgi:hypothetical protein